MRFTVLLYSEIWDMADSENSNGQSQTREKSMKTSDGANDLNYFKSLSKLGLILFSGLSLFFISGFIVITLLVSAKDKVPVPDLVGQIYLDKHNGLLEAGFRVRLERRFTTEYPQGYILSQSPSAGQIVGTGRRLNLVINQSENIVPVPKLVGSNEDLAKSMLDNIPKGGRIYSLNIGTVTKIPSNSPKGEILAQDPPEGTFLTPGSPVSILVSTGEASTKGQAYVPEKLEGTPAGIIQRMAYELKTPVSIETVNVENYEQHGKVTASEYNTESKAWKIKVGRFTLTLNDLEENSLPYHLHFRNSKEDKLENKPVTLALERIVDGEKKYSSPMYFAALGDVYPLYPVHDAEYVIWEGHQSITLNDSETTSKEIPEGAVPLIEEEKKTVETIPEPRYKFQVPIVTL